MSETYTNCVFGSTARSAGCWNCQGRVPGIPTYEIISIAVKLLDTVVFQVRNKDVSTVRIKGNIGWFIKLTDIGSKCAPFVNQSVIGC